MANGFLNLNVGNSAPVLPGLQNQINSSIADFNAPGGNTGINPGYNYNLQTDWFAGGPNAPMGPNSGTQYGDVGLGGTPAANAGTNTGTIGGQTGDQTEAPNYDFRATPGYEFRFGEGQRAIENSLIGSGSLLSGRAAKELTRYGQDYGAAEYQNVFNRRASIAGLAQPITQQMNQAGMNFANNVGNAYMNAGNAQASAYMNQGQAINNALQGGVSNYLFSQYMGG